jgi:anti-sigma regulatory factor (Ser/Thr protein kinase)
MMEEICAHIVDIVANSVTAGARNIHLTLREDSEKDLLTLRIVDDGKGMDEETASHVTDPFFSTKTGRKVGLGIPLLKGTAELCGGRFYLKSEIGKGTELFASFRLTHPDLPPLGSLKDTFLILVVSNPDVDFVFHGKTKGRDFSLDTKEVRAELGPVPINHPGVILFLTNYLDETL